MRSPLTGALVGIGFGMLFVTKVSNRTLTLSIGIVGLAMTLLLIVRARWFPHAVYKPRLADSLAIGIVCGFSSTIAHAAGPIFALFLLAQRVSKEAFVAANAIFFMVINLLKVPPVRDVRVDQHGYGSAGRGTAADDPSWRIRGLDRQPDAAAAALRRHRLRAAADDVAAVDRFVPGMSRPARQ